MLRQPVVAFAANLLISMADVLLSGNLLLHIVSCIKTNMRFMSKTQLKVAAKAVTEAYKPCYYSLLL